VWRALREEARLRQRQQNFVAAVSHELKSPLASLQLSVETLSLREPPLERVRELAGRMAADIARMTDMITKILDAARLEQRRIDLKPERVALLPALRRALDELESRRHKSSARVEIDVDEDLEVFADPAGVGTVLRNLLDNAFRSLPAGGGEVRVRAEPAERFVRLTVEDDGGGFPPDESSLLFDKFYRSGDEMRRKGAGQGLGLYIVRQFLDLENGRILAHSDGLGKGATFEVWWPSAREGAA
jgi:signal transduction histidine kinase